MEIFVQEISALFNSGVKKALIIASLFSFIPQTLPYMIIAVSLPDSVISNSNLHMEEIQSLGYFYSTHK